MNTDYPAFANGPNLLGGQGKLGVDLMQLIVAPTAAYKIAPNHSIGISPLLGYQRFKAHGVQAFNGFTSSLGNVTNRGYDDSFGYGVRIGYMGKLTPTFSIGAAYASTMKFDEFSKYKGLFAEQGGMDIPENYNLGVAWQATPAFLVALDYQRINYSNVNSVGNPSTNLAFAPLGADNGPGFGWKDVDVWKLGVEYRYSQQLTLRAGYNHTDNPIQSRDVVFNILAPAVVKDHATLGFTYTLASGNELTMAYMHAFKNDVTGLMVSSAAPTRSRCTRTRWASPIAGRCNFSARYCHRTGVESPRFQTTPPRLFTKTGFLFHDDSSAAVRWTTPRLDTAGYQ